MQPHLFRSVAIHQGIHSLGELLDKSVSSDDVPDVFCLDLYKDFDLDILKTLAEPATVTEADYASLTAAKPLR